MVVLHVGYFRPALPEFFYSISEWLGMLLTPCQSQTFICSGKEPKLLVGVRLIGLFAWLVKDKKTESV